MSIFVWQNQSERSNLSTHIARNTKGRTQCQSIKNEEKAWPGVSWSIAPAYSISWSTKRVFGWAYKLIKQLVESYKIWDSEEVINRKISQKSF